MSTVKTKPTLTVDPLQLQLEEAWATIRCLRAALICKDEALDRAMASLEHQKECLKSDYLIGRNPRCVRCAVEVAQKISPTTGKHK